MFKTHDFADLTVCAEYYCAFLSRNFGRAVATERQFESTELERETSTKKDGCGSLSIAGC